MEVELVTEGVSDDDNFILDPNIDDYSTFEGERCGLCMDIVIDRGVLDCCQHWFCFTCIDNWATITNLCPLCQNEFQLITCVPVYDTVGSSKADDDLFSREDDWCIEEENNTLSFPSYYIDENAVICLDRDGCKIRSGSVAIKEDSDLDTSIACDSCDTWYHAFCVGFDTEGTCDNSWLCPRCVANEKPKKSDVIAALRTSNHYHLENARSAGLVEATLSGKVSVSVADAGETAVVVSMVERNQSTERPSKKLSSPSRVDKDLKIEMLNSSSTANGPKLETPSTDKTPTQPFLQAQELEVRISQDTLRFPCPSLGQSELKATSADELFKTPSGFDIFVSSSRQFLDETELANEPCKSRLDLHLGSSVGCSEPVEDMKNDVVENQAAGDMQQQSSSDEYLLPGNVLGITGTKRKPGYYRDDVYTNLEDDTKAKLKSKVSTKGVRAERKSGVIDSKDKADESDSDEPQKCNSEEENTASDIMSIVQGTNRRPSKEHEHNNCAGTSSKERENAAGLRVKKIMRRTAEGKESSCLVENLRKEIREAVRNKSSKEVGEKIFDPKLLAAFRAAVVGSITEPAKKSPKLVVKAKKLMLQKGKVRENLTKKIYGIGGKRKRAWTRDCEIEFWKHRCLTVNKPEKVETLKSVLNLLRDSTEGTEAKQGSERKATNSILSRLYLADTSVFPRKDDVKPLSDLKATGSEENKGHSLMEKVSTPSLENHTAKPLEMNKISSAIRLPNTKGNKNITITGAKGEAASSKVLNPNKCPERPSSSSCGSQKEKIAKPNDVKTDKRKWALEVLARKMSATGSNATLEKQEDSAVRKGNYPLMVQLPLDMRPVLAPRRDNKIPLSVRQAQLYRLTEHLLGRADLRVIRRTAETELAVADAINIEKEVADRSNSKLVYVNLMSQELLKRSDNIKSCRATDSDPSPTSAVPTERIEEATNDVCDDPAVEEALRNAGLLYESPPNSPCHQKVSHHQNDGNDLSEKIGDEPDNVFEMDSHPELDIYGDFEYDLEDEDFVGASALKISTLHLEESKMKVVFSTLERENNALELEGREATTAVEVPKGSSGLLECGTETSIRSSSMAAEAEDYIYQGPMTDGGEDPSLDECEELYGPDKEPLIKRFTESTLTKACELMADDTVREKIEHYESSPVVKGSELGSDSRVETLVSATVGLHASVVETAPSCSQTSETEPIKEKLSRTDTTKQSDSFISVSRKVEAYIKEHIRPLCKSGVITVEQYRWAAGKTTDKVMKYHSKHENANFLVREGEKVKKLAQQYVEAAQQMERKQV